MANMFGKGRSTITEHIQNVFSENELEEESTRRKFRQVRVEGARTIEREIEHYSLDVIISVVYPTLDKLFNASNEIGEVAKIKSYNEIKSRSNFFCEDVFSKKRVKK